MNDSDGQVRADREQSRFESSSANARASHSGGSQAGYLARVGPIGLALPFLSSAALVLWLTRPVAAPDAPLLRVEVAPEDFEPSRIFEGRGDFNGGELFARLSPLQPDAERREFDNRALASRLELGEGQAWHLELSWRGESLGGFDDLSGWVVSDTYGEALQPLEPSASDPLRTLFAAPSALQANVPLHLLLWGRGPTGGVQLVCTPTGGAGPIRLDLSVQNTDGQGLPESLVGWAPSTTKGTDQ